jgi:hypothetical protein
LKRILSFVLKLLISITLLLYLFYFSGVVNTQEVIKTLRQTQLPIFFIVFFICICAVFISAKRWSLFLPEDIRYTRLVSLFFIGSFFNTFLPGLVGGEVIKTFYLYRDTRKGGVSIASVLMDKYMGLSAIVGISLIAFLGGYNYFKGTEIIWIIPIIMCVFLMTSLLLWKVNWGKISFLNSFYAPFMNYKTNKKIIYNGLSLSVLIQLIGITEVYLLSIAIGLKVPIIYFFIFVPIINALSAIPISIAGLGVRETGFAALFNMVFAKVGVTSDQAVSLSLLIFAVMCLVNLIGGIEYLRIRKLPEKGMGY